MKCPECGTDGAQQLLVSFLCPNKKCKNYDSIQEVKSIFKKLGEKPEKIKADANSYLEMLQQDGSFLPGSEKDIYATIEWAPTLPKVNIISATNYITTTSTSDIIATGMTLIPVAGTYMVTFSSSVSGSVILSLWSGGQQITGTERINISKAIKHHWKNDINNVMTQGIITVDGSQEIEVRWKVLDTGTMYSRTLSIMQVSL